MNVCDCMDIEYVCGKREKSVFFFFKLRLVVVNATRAVTVIKRHNIRGGH